MNAVVHTCPSCGAVVEVYARDATVSHLCPKAPQRARMVTFTPG